MTEVDESVAYVRARDRTMTLYLSATILSLLGIGVLSVYVLQLGPLVGPGVEQSFGFATALMFLFGALIVHLVDRSYRVWPLGRRVHPPNPGAVTDQAWRNLLAVVVLVAAGASIAYIIAGVLS